MRTRTYCAILCHYLLHSDVIDQIKAKETVIKIIELPWLPLCLNARVMLVPACVLIAQIIV